MEISRRRSTFFSLVSESRYSWDEEGQRETLRFMLMTASDLAASTKRWEVQRRVAELVTAEFFAQVSIYNLFGSINAYFCVLQYKKNLASPSTIVIL